MVATARRFPAGDASLRDRVGRLEGGWELLLRTLDEMRADRQRGEDRLAVMIAGHGAAATAAIGEVKALVTAQDTRIDGLETKFAGHAGEAAAEDKASERTHFRKGIWLGGLLGLVGSLLIAGVTIWSILR
jgi:hypothetical protein